MKNLQQSHNCRPASKHSSFCFPSFPETHPCISRYRNYIHYPALLTLQRTQDVKADLLTYHFFLFLSLCKFWRLNLCCLNRGNLEVSSYTKPKLALDQTFTFKYAEQNLYLQALKNLMPGCFKNKNLKQMSFLSIKESTAYSLAS